MLTDEERAFLDSCVDRCPVCGHLLILHDAEFGYCMVPECQQHRGVKENMVACGSPHEQRREE